MKSKLNFNDCKQIRMQAVLSMTFFLLALATAVSGCGKSSSSAPAPTMKEHKVVDGSAVRAAFSSADPSVKYPVEESVRVAEAGGFADALPQLQTIATGPDLTAGQKKALNDFIQQIQTHMAR